MVYLVLKISTRVDPSQQPVLKDDNQLVFKTQTRDLPWVGIEK